MPISNNDRWKCQIVSPIDEMVLWEGIAPTTKLMAEKYQQETGNDYLTLQKLTRCSLGKSKNPLIKLFKIGEFGTRTLEN